MKQLLFYISLITLLSACSTTGVRVDNQQLGMIKQGETTEQEVIQRLGKPTSITVTPERRVLVYAYTQNNNVERQVASSTASMVGGHVGGPIGSLAGSLLGGNVVPSNQTREQLSIEIDPVTYKVVNYQRQQTMNYQ